MPPSAKEIKQWMRRIDSSTLSVDSFFASRDVPFSRAQYFRYKKLLNKNYEFKVAPLRGGNRKIGEREEILLRGIALRGPVPPVAELCAMLKSEIGTDVGDDAVRRAVYRLFPKRQRPRVGRPRKRGSKVAVNSMGGFELIVAVAYHLKWPSSTAGVICDAIRDRQKRPRSHATHDSEGRGEDGRFTKAYSARPDVRALRFASVSEKRGGKNWASMNIMDDSASVIARKCLALLSLPAVTNNGKVRNINLSSGEALGHLCGFDYRHATIIKFLAELKYLGLADWLLQYLPSFWQRCWGADVSKAAGPILCYYVDGNTRAVWSSKRINQSKVTMSGRVMGCLEAVFVHDGLGHPVYFETYPGHAPTGEHVLGLFEKIENSIMEVPGSRTRVCRAIVMDSASNSVKTLRAFAAQTKYHYITSLDDNQWSPRKICQRSYPVPYRYGKATLRDTRIELADSKDKKHLIAPRAICIEWRPTKRREAKKTALVTSIPRELADASEVVRAYFRRWPAQELMFRGMKAAFSLNRICGYGKKLVTNERVKSKLKELDAKRKTLEDELNGQLGEIDLHERALAGLIPREYRLRQKTTVKDGIRHVPARICREFAKLGLEIKRHEAAKKRIAKENPRAFKRYRKTMNEWSRLQHKTTVYQLDVELDQILTYFRASLAHMCAYFIKHFLGGQPIAFDMLFHRINRLQAKIEESRHGRNVTLSANKKDAPMMEMLRPAIEKLNALRIRGHGGRVYNFTLTEDSLIKRGIN